MVSSEVGTEPELWASGNAGCHRGHKDNSGQG